jgi:hypothetical protein
MIQEQFGHLLGDKLDKANERLDTVEGNTVKTSAEIFISNVTNAVPDWKSINGWSSEGIAQDPKWTVFLNQRVPGTNPRSFFSSRSIQTV